MTRYARFSRAVGACILGASCVALFSASAAAQGPDKIMVTGEAAKKALTNGEISGEAAAKITQGCLDFAAQHNFAAVVFVLDPFGDIVHAHRMDGIRPVQFQSALGKAKAALFSRAPNRAPNPNNPGAVAGEVRTWMRGQDPNPGGLPIIVNDQMIGAVGVAGSDPLDDACARAGLAAVGIALPAPPAPPRPAAAQP